MIFQHFNLLSSRTVYDNVALPLELAGKSKQEIAATVEPLLELVGLSKLRDRYPAQISGGQKQRVGIARALASKPKVLLSDEAPRRWTRNHALDPRPAQADQRELGLTIVMITHQMEVIKQVCDRVAVLEAGQVVESGRVIDVFLRPQHEVTRAMIGDVIAQELPVSVLKRVESRLGNGRDHVYRLAFTGENVDQPVLAQAIRQHGLDFNILHGHIDEIQGQAFGSLAIMATGELADVRAAMDYLQSQGVVVEEIEHVV
jgi:D-methionine transport system ATP-binding protein